MAKSGKTIEFIYFIKFTDIWKYLLILNVMPTGLKQDAKGQQQTREVVKCSKNTCLEHSTCEQVHWKHLMGYENHKGHLFVKTTNV